MKAEIAKNPALFEKITLDEHPGRLLGFDHGVRHPIPSGLSHVFKQNPQSLRQNTFPSEQLPQLFLLLVGGSFRLKLCRCC